MEPYQLNLTDISVVVAVVVVVVEVVEVLQGVFVAGTMDMGMKMAYLSLALMVLRDMVALKSLNCCLGMVVGMQRRLLMKGMVGGCVQLPKQLSSGN